MAQAEMQAAIAALNLGATSEFVPFSKSRNKNDKHLTLNWRVTIKRNGRDVLTTDYSAGVAHCPAYKASIKELGNRNSLMRDAAIRSECETGRKTAQVWDSAGASLGFGITSRNAIPAPELADVLYSLAAEADAIDHGNFEDWASNLGYDADSRAHERIYKACLETALKLRAGLGDDGLRMVRDACQDY